MALLVLLLAITGLLLNHTGTLRLDRRFIDTEWLLNWYDIEAPQRIISYAAGQHTISLVEDQLYLDDQSISGHYESLAGAIRLQDMIIVAIDTQLILFSLDGELIERIGAINGQTQILGAIGSSGDSQLAIETNNIYLTDTDFSGWRVQDENSKVKIQWSSPAKLPDPTRQQLSHDYRANILTLERVMLDLHSGRILGDLGVYIMDAAAILLCLLSLSGFWMWLQQRNKRLAHRRNQT